MLYLESNRIPGRNELLASEALSWGDSSCLPRPSLCLNLCLVKRLGRDQRRGTLFFFTSGRCVDQYQAGYTPWLRDSLTNDLPVAGYAPVGPDPTQPAAGVGSRRSMACRSACAAGRAGAARLCPVRNADRPRPTVPPWSGSADGGGQGHPHRVHRRRRRREAPVRGVAVPSNRLHVLLSLL